jgi:hypothetical protein
MAMRNIADQRRREQLRRCQTEYAQLKARLRGVGFICEGSLVERWMPCGKPNCACASDRDSWHGPYFQLSWKEKGKTVSRRLSPEHATLYRQWVANRQRLHSIIQKMQQVSRRACRHLLQAEKSKKTTPKPGVIPSSLQ